MSSEGTSSAVMVLLPIWNRVDALTKPFAGVVQSDRGRIAVRSPSREVKGHIDRSSEHPRLKDYDSEPFESRNLG